VMPSGPVRSGVLRIIVAHQLGSPALNKLRVGGWQYFRPSTLESHIRFVRDTPRPIKVHFLVEPLWLRQHWMMDICLRNRWLMAVLQSSGLITQLGVVAVCLSAGGVALKVALVLACSFHLLAAPLLGVFFPFSIQCYMVALLPGSAQDPSCLLSIPALLTALVLGISTICMTESWPLNGQVLFPYNAEQIEALKSLFGRYLLAHSTGEPRVSDICLTELCCSICPANVYPLHLKALGGPSFASCRESLLSDRVAFDLAEWVRRTRCFIDEREEGQPGRCFDDVVVREACPQVAGA